MAVTRRVHVVKLRPQYARQVDAGDGGEYAQIYSDPTVKTLMAGFAPAERIVGITSLKENGEYLIYIFTESFGLGPVTP